MSATTDVLQGLGLASGTSATSARDGLTRLLSEWRRYFAAVGFTFEFNEDHLRLLTTAMSAYFEAPSRKKELELLEEACENPLYGIMLVLAALPGTANRQYNRLWTLLFSEQDAGRTRVFDAPAPGRKYLIISDIHRDSASDDRGPLRTGSISHFKDNTHLYERILQHVIDSPDYTLLEGGDCEELWFIRSIQEHPRRADGSLDIAARLREIIDSHPRVYDKLRKLHKAGRYFRIYGNHDSFLKPDGADDSVQRVLRTEMERDQAGPFQIWDSFVIDGVKTMMDYGGADVLTDVRKLATKQISTKTFADRLFKGRLGLDANDYTEKARMLVTHGHQFDFWNSPNNEILGLLIANTVGTFVDRHMDPFLDIRGFALQGNPLFEFESIFAKLPVFDSWPAGKAAMRFAHETQHLSNGDRVLADSIMFYESIAALWGAFGMALNHRSDTGEEVTPAKSRQELDLATPSGIVEYLRRHHFHHICIGHTHNPHSQPAFTLDNFGNLALPLKPLTSLITLLLPSFLEPQWKTMYFNSGTAGWMEGVVWGIEIDETGQARLVFWTENSVGPEYMDWELKPLDPYIKEHLREGYEAAFDAPWDEGKQHLKDFQDRMLKRLVSFNVDPEALSQALQRAATLPIHALALALTSPPADAVRKWVLEEVSGLEGRVEKLQKQLDTLRSFTFDVILSAKRRALSGFKSLTETEQCVIQAPISSADRERLLQFKSVMMGLGLREDQALHAAGHAMSMFDQFPRNLPFFSTVGEPQNPEARLNESKAPVLQSLLSSLWMYPPPGETVLVQGVKLESRFALEGKYVRLTVTLSRGTDGSGTGTV